MLYFEVHRSTLYISLQKLFTFNLINTVYHSLCFSLFIVILFVGVKMADKDVYRN